ncbi:response regulator transcription factor [Wenzhouxiangella sp. XN79A]|uniref:response regulator transcription factor n=1 Tax=Wenzhouxiangella sp. XN79A TaxID=2724193 RepID=UPI00144AD2C9|nr:response regulator transcription factor [Wenzhouxiangella sp. XN79A]NKI36103.1 response regulator transcription factor [Wenzhouxiangella sp. XN79A]
MLRIVIADDHPLFRAALAQAVAATVEAVELLEAPDFDTTLVRLTDSAPIDLVLLDLHMPGSQGLAGLARLRGLHPEVAVVVVSANEDPRVIRRALDQGAAGFIPKSAGLDELGTAIETVLDCRSWVPERLAAAVDAEHADDEDAALAHRIGQLTPQQYKVLSRVADGQLNKQIADDLGIQERTVKAHMSEIFQRLGVRNRTQAGVAFRRLELIEPAARIEDG